MMVDPALSALYDLVQQKRDPRARLGAVKDILDRNDLGAKQKMEHSTPDGQPLLVIELPSNNRGTIEPPPEGGEAG